MNVTLPFTDAFSIFTRFAEIFTFDFTLNGISIFGFVILLGIVKWVISILTGSGGGSSSGSGSGGSEGGDDG